jgi:hypothetical protein
MAQKPTDESKLAEEKRVVARRARRLAQTQMLEADRQRLTQFAAELEKEAEGLEQAMSGLSLPAVGPPEVQQQQSADSRGAKGKGLADDKRAKEVD